MKPPTIVDIRKAIAWALRDTPPARVDEVAGAIRSCWVMDVCQSTRENRAEAILGQSCVTSDAQRAALVALGADAAGDRDGFFLHAFAAFDAYRQSQRAASRRGGDALDGLIRRLLDDHPKFSRPYLWAEIARQAKEGGEILADYDPFADLVSFQPRPHADLQDIGYEAFSRRVSRIKKSSGREPVCVPPDLEDANTPPRLAA